MLTMLAEVGARGAGLGPSPAGCVVCESRARGTAGRTIARTLCMATRALIGGSTAPEELPLALGIAAGSLTRLFRSYLGVSPAGLAAFARGTRSSCPMGAGPRRYRAPQVACLELSLPYDGPLDFEGALALLAIRATEGVEVIAPTRYRRTVAVATSVGSVSVTPGQWHQLHVSVELDDWSPLVHVVEGVRGLFNLEVDIKAAVHWLQRDSIVGPLVRARPGLRPPGSWNLFEAAVKAVLCSGWDVRGSQWLGGLARATGGLLPRARSQAVSQLFPTPEAISDAPMSALGLPFAKAVAVHSLARAVRADPSILDASLPMLRRVQLLAAVPGVGPLSAARYAWIAGDPDAYPERSGASLPGTRLTASRKRSTHVEDRWRPFRSFAYAHLAAVTAERLPPPPGQPRSA